MDGHAVFEEQHHHIQMSKKVDLADQYPGQPEQKPITKHKTEAGQCFPSQPDLLSQEVGKPGPAFKGKDA